MDELSINRQDRICKPAGNQAQIIRLAKQTAVTASDEQKDKVYRALLARLCLKQKHKDDLIGRGLKAPMIDHMELIGYKSTNGA